jgi:hypothetical protein
VVVVVDVDRPGADVFQLVNQRERRVVLAEAF